MSRRRCKICKCYDLFKCRDSDKTNSARSWRVTQSWRIVSKEDGTRVRVSDFFIICLTLRVRVLWFTRHKETERKSKFPFHDNQVKKRRRRTPFHLSLFFSSIRRRVVIISWWYFLDFHSLHVTLCSLQVAYILGFLAFLSRKKEGRRKDTNLCSCFDDENRKYDIFSSCPSFLPFPD